uniref:Uncharacterized protein n=1 Tax=Oryza meridionalis TaxID=40149 RepID=A0A0E0E304_9ORYZ
MAYKSQWMDVDVQGRAHRPCEGMRMETRGRMAGMAACDKAGGEGKSEEAMRGERGGGGGGGGDWRREGGAVQG